MHKKKKVKTRVVVTHLMEKEKDVCKDVTWNEELWVPAQVPIINPRVIIKVMDEDTVTDEVIGSLLFDLQEIIEKSGKDPESEFFW